MTATEWLARAHAVTDGVTPGPWVPRDATDGLPSDGPTLIRIYADVTSGEPGEPNMVADLEYDAIGSADATFIAASRTMLPAAVAAIEAVLALHQPVWCNDRNDYQCADCGADLTDATPDCPTVRAITAHLDGAS